MRLERPASNHEERRHDDRDSIDHPPQTPWYEVDGNQHDDRDLDENSRDQHEAPGRGNSLHNSGHHLRKHPWRIDRQNIGKGDV
jgi:hypothetical protein